MSILVDHEIESYCSLDVQFSRMKRFEVEVVGEDLTTYNTYRGAKSIPMTTPYPELDYEHIDKLCVGQTYNTLMFSPRNFNKSVALHVTRTADALPMISPFVNESVKLNDKGEKILSYGLSTAGYDFRVAPEFKVFTNAHSTLVDCKSFDEQAFVTVKGDKCIIPPNSFVLSHTVEKFCMPRNVIGICVGKSTLARVGIMALVTPVEPGWEGYLTLEFANLTPLPAVLYANEGGLQVNFHETAEPRVSYADRAGKYQSQASEVVLPKV